MFILPPPPKSTAYYPSGLGYRDGLGGPGVLEATNSVTHLDANSVQSFTAPEGVYGAKECIYLATPLPHPSDPPPAVINPLAPTHTLPSNHSSGLRLSTCVLQSSTGGTGGTLAIPSAPRKSARQPSTTSNKSFGGWTSSLFKKEEAASGGGGGGSGSGSGSEGATINEEVLSTSAPLPSSFGNPLSRKDTANSSTSQLNDKKKKPKNSLSKNNSSFISRTVLHDNLHKRLAERSPNDTHVWANMGRSISWLDLSPSSKQIRQEPLIKILFTKSHPLCHDVNNLTKAMTNIDVVIGTSAGDIIYVECISARYNRVNKNGDVTRSPVTDIRWVPGSENLFMSAHADGTICIFDKERDDGGFVMQGLSKQQDARSTDVFRIIKSLHSAPLLGGGKNSSAPGPQGASMNPVAVYKVSNGPITSMKFSPTNDMLAITNKDGYLRLLNLANEQLTDIFPSYYGGFLCASWSPDGKYLATGGQDDMVCIWNIGEKSKKLVVRLQGHSSWVRAVQFDHMISDDSNYRLGSVGDDGKLLLWDFAPKSLNRPKVQANTKSRQRSNSKTVSGSNGTAKPAQSTAASAAANGNGNGNGNGNNLDDHTSKIESGKTELHPFVSQGETPIAPPVVSKAIHLENQEAESLSDLVFLEQEIIVAGKDGRIWVFDRPGFK